MLNSPIHFICRLCAAVALGLGATGGALAQGPQSIFPDTDRPTGIFADDPYALGTVFRSTAPGKITHLRVFSTIEEGQEGEGGGPAQHMVTIWRNAPETVLYGPVDWTYGGDDAFISLPLPTPLDVEAGVDYTVAISVARGKHYPTKRQGFIQAGNNGLQLSWVKDAGKFTLGGDELGRPTNSFGSNGYFRDVIFVPTVTTTSAAVKGNGVLIVTEDTTPASSDHTQFGGRYLGGATAPDRVFTVENTGTAPLMLNGTPLVTLTGDHPGDFQIITPPSASVPVGGSTMFTVRFVPTAVGARTATVTVPLSGTASYTFTVQGIGMTTGELLLGNQESGTPRSLGGSGAMAGTSFQALRNMRVTSLEAFVVSAPGLVKAAIFADSAGGSPVNLLGESAELTSPVEGWQSFSLLTSLDLVAGEKYWLLIWSDSSLTLGGSAGGTRRQGSVPYDAVWPVAPVLDQVVGAGELPPGVLAVYTEGTPLGVSGAEIQVRGNNLSVAPGATTTSSANGTYLGALDLPAGAATQEFNIVNVGSAPLALTGAPPVTISGANAADFSITAQPTTPVAINGGASPFTLRFAPATAGVKTALVTIAHGAPFGNPFTFTVQGSAVSRQAQSIFSDDQSGNSSGPEGTFYELGTVFSPLVEGAVTHLRVYSLEAEAGVHTARLWRNSDEVVIGGPYPWTYGGTAGWITLDIDDVAIVTGESYTISVSTGDAPSFYPIREGFFAAEGTNGFDLSYPQGAGVFSTVPETRPGASFNNASYYRDVIFSAGGAGALPPFNITAISRNPANNQVTLTWESVAGATYVIERSPILTAAPWTVLPGSIASGGTATSFTDTSVPAGTSSLFYRVRRIN